MLWEQHDNRYFRWALLATFLLAILSFVFIRLVDSGKAPATSRLPLIEATRPVPANDPVAPPTVILSPLQKRFNDSANAAEAKVVLRDAFQNSRIHRDGFKEIIELCPQVEQRWPQSFPEIVWSEKLIPECYYEMGEPEKARKAFWDHAHAEGARVRKALDSPGVEKGYIEKCVVEDTTEAVRRNIQRMTESGDWMEALVFCDELSQRYPGTSAEDYAKDTIARYCKKKRQPLKSIELYKSILEKPGNENDDDTLVGLEMVARNYSNTPGVLEEVIKIRDSAKDNAVKSRLSFVIARCILSQKKTTHITDAIDAFNEVADLYPDTEYASRALKQARELKNELDNKAQH